LGSEAKVKVLITGGLGYLGSVLVPKLIQKGVDVRILESFVYGNFLSDETKGVELVRGDIRDYELMNKATEDVDAVIHLAGIIGDAAANLDKELTINVNFFATKRLAKLCSEKNLRLVFSSTCSVYGARPNEMITEKSPIAPLSLYAMSKLMAEEAILKSRVNYIIFRLGTLFGLSPRMRFDLVINRFVAQALQERKITVFGGQQRRPFVHVQDISDIFAQALTIDLNGTYNVGGNNYKISETAEIIEKKTGCSVSVANEMKDPRDYAVDSLLAREILGFKDPKRVDFAVDEIQTAYNEMSIKDYKEPIFNNEEWLKRLWTKECS
jgi:nucleoside-diphosphate-sugar epimerase